LKVVLFPQAEHDLDEIFEPLFSRVVKWLRLLERFPELGAPMQGPFYGYRSTVVGLCRIIYRAQPAAVLEVAYLRNGRRGPIP
jgi:plasmid stabilization system protein ParE